MLAVVFEDLEAFSKEYHENLTKGGLFVPTLEPIEIRSRVEIGIDLQFCNQAIVLAAEVVHCVPPELEAAGAVPGVAVQFEIPAAEVRDVFEQLVGQIPALEQPVPAAKADDGSNRRGAAREVVRVGARVCNSQGEKLQGMTRNLSATGLLFSVEGDPPEIGEQVVVTLTNSKSGETLEIPSEVMRKVKGEAGDVPAVGIRFSPDKESQERTKSFLRRLRDADHNRRLGGINGKIDEAGLASVLQSFGTSSQEGTLTVMKGSQEGYIAYSQGCLVATRIGRVTGMKALVRLLRWTQGHFEFHAHIDDQIVRDPPVPLDAVILDAMREINRTGRDRAVRFAPEVSFDLSTDGAASYAGDMGKIECAIIDLVGVGANVRKLLDVIPEADARIHEALVSLIEHEILIRRMTES